MSDFIETNTNDALIQSGIKGEMPSLAKKYNEQDIAAIVAYLKTLH
jgi:mono/diheme cytochrome c family protein